MIRLGKGLFSSGAHHPGIAVLRRAQQRHPADFWANNELADCLMGGQSHRPAEAVRFATAAVALRPRSAGAFADLGAVLAENGDSTGAVAAYREAIRLKPDDHAAYYRLGDSLMKLNDPDGAIAAIREGIRLYPNSGWAYLLGNALEMKGDLDGAIAVHRDEVRRNPDHGIAHNQLGRALRWKGEWAGAAAAHRESLRVYPDFRTAHAGLALALWGQGDRDGMVAAVRRALELLEAGLRQEPTDWGAYQLMAWYLAAFTDERIHDPRRAVELAWKAIRIAPEMWWSWDVLGLAYYRAGDWAAAIAAEDKVLLLRPGGIEKSGAMAQASFGQAWLVLALAYGRRGERDQAREWYDKASRWLRHYRIPDPHLRGLQAEAAALLGIPDAPPAPAGPRPDP
jgi:tetratricopeptide (TPR) repeat protein